MDASLFFWLAASTPSSGARFTLQTELLASPGGYRSRGRSR
jgi:hypothetical protein